MSEGLEPRQIQQILEGFLLLEGCNCKLDMGQRTNGLATDRGNGMWDDVTECVGDELLLKQTVYKGETYKTKLKRVAGLGGGLKSP